MLSMGAGPSWKERTAKIPQQANERYWCNGDVTSIISGLRVLRSKSTHSILASHLIHNNFPTPV